MADTYKGLLDKEAGESIEDGRCVAAPDGSDQVSTTTAASDEVYGVAITSPDEAGDAVTVAVDGVVELRAAGSGISDGDQLEPDSNGRVTTQSSGTILGVALEDSQGEDHLVKVRLYGDRAETS